MKHVLSVLVKNQTGVLVRVASMFSRREFNIDSLAVGVTENPEFSRITVVVYGDEYLVDQMMKQLEKLPDVEAVQRLAAGDASGLCRIGRRPALRRGGARPGCAAHRSARRR